jgi:phenylalanyl-tRNA synthetase beta chain
MNLLIPDKWLRDFILTSASPDEIAKDVSLCGPSVERVIKSVCGPVYSVEVTGNRIDAASVYGFAREVNAILPRFGQKATFKEIKIKKQRLVKDTSYLKVKLDSDLCSHFTAVLIKNVVLEESPDWLKERLSAVGARPINNIVDISNYVMCETGQPIHTFDYDKILGKTMALRESKKGEVITTLDGVERKLPGGDIIIEDGKGRLIDLCGIMGGALSAVDATTKNVLLFVQTYNPQKIRRTSMLLSHRTDAAVLFEKDLDPESVYLGLQRSLDLFLKLTKGQPAKTVLDIYPKVSPSKKLNLNIRFVEEKLGVNLSKKEINDFLIKLGFKLSWLTKDNFSVIIPSYRAKDISIPEDVVEEIARIYGYQNIPSHLMSGAIPSEPRNGLFVFESNIKKLLKGFGGYEVYTSSLAAIDEVDPSALKLSNPLGKEALYLRTSLLPSLSKAASENKSVKDPFWLYEMANIYLPKKDDLPEEREMLAAVFKNMSYREAKGVVEGLTDELHLEVDYELNDAKDFIPSKRLLIKYKNQTIGVFGEIANNLFYFELIVADLFKIAGFVGQYHPTPRYPAQIEDLTFVLPQKTKIGEVIASMKSVDKQIADIILKEVYKEAFTFRVWYLNLNKTLNNDEVGRLREKIITKVKNSYGGVIK